MMDSGFHQYDVDTFARLKEILSEVISLSPEERESVLRKHADGDPALLVEARRILRLEPRTEFLEPAVELEAPPHATIARRTGQQIGSFKVLRWIASGGMGDVYEAEQRDTSLRRRVAIKVIRKSLGVFLSPEQMHEEGEFLDRLHHPNIVKTLGAGKTQDDAPYIVMEYVEGNSLTRYCDENSLTIMERINLFADVCEAVYYAHQNLVVHCDLKPSNILVTAERSIKLLDFGLARLLGARPGSRTGAPSKPIGWMTPRYSSPEQKSGAAITTSSDIYSLGAILFELLVGMHHQRPQQTHAGTDNRETDETCVGRASDLVGIDGVDWAQVARERSTTVRCLRRSLRGDIDCILWKSLRHGASSRYTSSQHLASDLRRHLGYRPVEARRKTLGYTLTKAARRNRIAATAGVIAMVSLLSVVIVASFSVRRLEQEWQQTKLARVRSQMAMDFFSRLISSPQLRANDGRADVQEVLRIAEGQIQSESLQDHVVEASIRTTLGQAYLNLCNCDAASKQFERVSALQRASPNPDNLASARTASLLSAAQKCLGDYRAAEKTARRALRMYEAADGPDSISAADALHRLAVLLQLSGQYANSKPVLRRAISIRERNETDPAKLAALKSALAIALFAENRADEAAPMMEGALAEIVNGRLSELSMATAWNNYARLLSRKGEFEKANRLLDRALALQRGELGPLHPDVARTLNNQGSIMFSTGDITGAIGRFRESLYIKHVSLGRNHPEYAQGLLNLGIALRSAKAFEEAEAVLTEAAAIYDDRPDSNVLELASLLHTLGTVQMDRGEFGSAVLHFKRAVKIHQGIAGVPRKGCDRTLILLGMALIEDNKLTEAEAHLKSTVAFLEENRGPSNTETLDAMSVLGLCLSRAGRIDEGCDLMVSSYERMVDAGKASHSRSGLMISRMQSTCP